MNTQRKLTIALEFCARNGLWQEHAQLITSAIWQPSALPEHFERITFEQVHQTTGKPFAGKSILIVEDEPEIAEIISEIVSSLTDNWVVAHDGWEAVMELGNRESFDLIISDLRLPKVGGKKLTEHILRHSPNSQVIIYTGFPEEILADHDSLKIAKVICKPAANDCLDEEIRRALRRSGVASWYPVSDQFWS